MIHIVDQLIKEMVIPHFRDVYGDVNEYDKKYLLKEQHAEADRIQQETLARTTAVDPQTGDPLYAGSASKASRVPLSFVSKMKTDELQIPTTRLQNTGSVVGTGV